MVKGPDAGQNPEMQSHPTHSHANPGHSHANRVHIRPQLASRHPMRATQKYSKEDSIPMCSDGGDQVYSGKWNRWLRK